MILIFGPALHELADNVRQWVRAIDLVPVLRDYAERECGFMLLLSLLALEEGDAMPALRAARIFSISRTHASGLLRRAVQDGLAESQPEGYIAGRSYCRNWKCFSASPCWPSSAPSPSRKRRASPAEGRTNGFRLQR